MKGKSLKRLLSKYLKLLVLLTLSLTSNTVFSATISTTASGGFFSNASTWEGGVLPSAEDDVVVIAKLFLDLRQEILFKNLSVEVGGEITGEDAYLTIEGEVYNQGDIDVEVNSGSFINEGVAGKDIKSLSVINNSDSGVSFIATEDLEVSIQGANLTMRTLRNGGRYVLSGEGGIVLDGIYYLGGTGESIEIETIGIEEMTIVETGFNKVIFTEDLVININSETSIEATSSTINTYFYKLPQLNAKNIIYKAQDAYCIEATQVAVGNITIESGKRILFWDQNSDCSFSAEEVINNGVIGSESSSIKKAFIDGDFTNNGLVEKDVDFDISGHVVNTGSIGSNILNLRGQLDNLGTFDSVLNIYNNIDGSAKKITTNGEGSLAGEVHLKEDNLELHRATRFLPNIKDKSKKIYVQNGSYLKTSNLDAFTIDTVDAEQVSTFSVVELWHVNDLIAKESEVILNNSYSIIGGEVYTKSIRVDSSSVNTGDDTVIFTSFFELSEATTYNIYESLKIDSKVINNGVFASTRQNPTLTITDSFNNKGAFNLGRAILKPNNPDNLPLTYSTKAIEASRVDEDPDNDLSNLALTDINVTGLLQRKTPETYTLYNGEEVFKVILINQDFEVPEIVIPPIDYVEPPAPDTTAPVITMLGQDETVEVGAVYTDAGATADDELDGNITSDIVILSTVDTSMLGEYSVKYNVTDDAGNQADEVVRIVTVTTPAPSGGGGKSKKIDYKNETQRDAENQQSEVQEESATEEGDEGSDSDKDVVENDDEEVSDEEVSEEGGEDLDYQDDNESQRANILEAIFASGSRTQAAEEAVSKKEEKKKKKEDIFKLEKAESLELQCRRDYHSLLWTDKSENEEGYVIEKKVGDEQWVKIDITEEDIKNFKDLAVDQNSEYRYRVYSFAGDLNSEYSEEVICGRNYGEIISQENFDKKEQIEESVEGLIKSKNNQGAFFAGAFTDIKILKKCEQTHMTVTPLVGVLAFWITLLIFIYKKAQAWIFNPRKKYRLYFTNTLTFFIPNYFWLVAAACTGTLWFPVVIIITLTIFNNLK